MMPSAAAGRGARRVDAVLFDKDGTLFDFEATWVAWARAFLLRVSGGDQAMAARLGRGIGFDLNRSRFATDSVVIAGTAGEVADALLPLLLDYDRPGLIRMLNEEAAQAPQAEAVPLAPLLDGLRAMGLRLGVATNDAEQPARAHLGAAGVLDRFDFVAGFDSGHGSKPEPGQLLAFADRMEVEPARVAMVGDSLHDLAAGRAAGMVTVAVLTGPATHGVLARKADIVLPDIGHLPAWLSGAR